MEMPLIIGLLSIVAVRLLILSMIYVFSGNICLPVAASLIIIAKTGQDWAAAIITSSSSHSASKKIALLSSFNLKVFGAIATQVAAPMQRSFFISIMYLCFSDFQNSVLSSGFVIDTAI